ncbi:MAG: DUF4102 domain-containing protein [Burkholderiaceae bacterium]|nr:MAG: DUF4102 domain-containing protein [Burkholderiaceae bacterium]
MRLTDRQCAACTPNAREYLWGDDGGLSLRIRPAGSKGWAFRYRDVAGKGVKLGLGAYPRVGLAEARKKANDKREALASWAAYKETEAARRAGQAIERQFLLLETTPDIGRPFPEMPELRELAIAFGDSGYVALYDHELADDAVYILAFRHQKEAGY